jgi:hypothetical protein
MLVMTIVLGRDSPSGLHYCGKDKTLEVTARVSRNERAYLLKKFKLEQRLDRRRNKIKVRAMWNAEIADGKENLLSQADAMEASSQVPIDPEVESEAYENSLRR